MKFDISKYKHCFKTKENTAYFWHGRTTQNGIAYMGDNNAAKIAKQNGGKTLEMCMLEYKDELMDAGVDIDIRPDGTFSIDYILAETQEEKDAFWQDCSECFAEQAQGDVHVIEGTDLRYFANQDRQYEFSNEEYYNNSIWNTTEHSTLASNPDVTSVITVDAVKGEETGEVETFEREHTTYEETTEE